MESLFKKPPGTRLELGPTVSHREGQPAPLPVQMSFADLGSNLIDVTFIVVDLETTGGKPGKNAITEFGAVKIRGGDVIGEFATLVNPETAIPAHITVLTGITNAMVLPAPTIAEVMPSFIEFIGHDPETVLVAHNAKFDIGHLKGACRDLGLEFPKRRVLDTLLLARRTYTRDEVRNYKLSSLAAAIETSVEPSHRALDDARATVDVFHAILDRLGPLGVTHLDDLFGAQSMVPERRRLKAHLADGLPRGPGVYKFIGPRDEVLYIGTSANLYKRVRTYFTAAEKRKRIGEMVDLSVRVDVISTPTVLEANILEVRLIGELAPPYNRRSRARTRHWLTLTEEPHPRLKIAKSAQLDRLAGMLGPFTSHRLASAAAELLTDASHLRTCTQRLPSNPDGRGACHLLDLGKCSGPCLTGVRQDDAVGAVEGALRGDVAEFVDASMERMARLSDDARFELALTERNRTYSLVGGSVAATRFRPLLLAKRIVAVAREENGWEVIIVDHGRLIATGTATADEDPRDIATWLATTHHQSDPPAHALATTSMDELRLIYNWLWRDNVRLLEVSQPAELSVPVRSGAAIRLPEIDRTLDFD